MSFHRKFPTCLCYPYYLFFNCKIHKVKKISFHAIFQNTRHHASELFLLLLLMIMMTLYNHMPDINSEMTIISAYNRMALGPFLASLESSAIVYRVALRSFLLLGQFWKESMYFFLNVKSQKKVSHYSLEKCFLLPC